MIGILDKRETRRKPAAPPPPTGEELWQSFLDPAAFAHQRLGFEPDPTQAALLRDNHRRCIINCTRQWGKSTVTAAKAVHQAFFQPESLSVVLSPSARQSAEFLRKAEHFLRKLDIKPRGDGDNEISLLLPNRSRIVGLPGQEATIRGFSSVALLLIDEAARVEDSLYWSVRPMLAVGDGQLWLMSTPNGARGFFHQTWSAGGPEWQRISVTAEQCPRISRRHLEEERRTMGERWFQQEYLCQFLSAQGQVFDADLVYAALSDDVTPLRL